MTTITWGGADVPDGSDDADIAALWLAYANSFRATQVPYFADKTARNSAASSLPAGHHAACIVGQGVGLCWYDGSAWKNLSPSQDSIFARNYGAGQRVNPSQAWVDGTAAGTLTGVVSGQVLDIEVRASIRVDANDLRQSLQLSADVTGASLTLQQLAPEMERQPATMTTFDEYRTHTSRARFLATSGTITIKVALAAGAAAGVDLVMQQAQLFVKLYPVDAA